MLSVLASQMAREESSSIFHRLSSVALLCNVLVYYPGSKNSKPPFRPQWISKSLPCGFLGLPPMTNLSHLPVRDHAVGPLIIRRGLERKGEKKGKKKLKPRQTMKSLLTKRGSLSWTNVASTTSPETSPPKEYWSRMMRN